MRLGGTRAIHVNVRVIATTAAKVEQRVEDGTFRRDLYYQFGAFHIHFPPLRERAEDIPLLARRLLDRLAGRFGHSLEIDDAVLATLQEYAWPGNGRELASVLERAAAYCQDRVIRVHDLPPAVRSGWILPPNHAIPQPVQSLTEAEREAIMRAGWAHQGQMARMAKSLGISRTTLWRKMRQFNLEAGYFKRLARRGAGVSPNGHNP
jgi:transcriptional activator for dhaKLM operon